ncbi:APC family permease [Occallatibacter riparius]|uniref:Amino acid transporter n=1 Tax=Occallatibacter riparius TaxID=1002689 RepID=A0A9J7BKM5_9BACT|nr:amino acid transporter [Occallatibacter riparius]UWZ83428.1 amino acid transporter [Occallatibacter riparius]
MMLARLTNWLLADLNLPKGVHSKAEPEHAWWRVMCLTGVDYFSTLGYQPGIAFLAAGVLSPMATLVLVLVTLFAALPLYARVAKASPNGQGSIAMLEGLFPEWGGKIFVLVLLGFATTDFTITMTLSAADAAAHVVHNPFAPAWLTGQMLVTLLLLAALSVVFLKGFKEAIGIAVGLVGAYLLLNAVVTVRAAMEVLRHPHVVRVWETAVWTVHPHWWGIAGVCLLLFPRLALGLSGFETGVAVMPLIKGELLEDRIRNTRKLLATAALIMSVFLIATSFVTTVLIPAKEFEDGGQANGRALAYLAHQYMGSAFGTVYDISTILILAFAGASAMAGLLNLIPRYLPRFGMAPEWARASRPLVLVFMGVAFVVTWAFRANVDAQGGAYATGVLVLITSAACAVTMSAWRTRAKWFYLLVALIFVYTTLMNIRERPEGLKISLMFIGAILLVGFASRALRSTELRITGVELDATAEEIIRSAGNLSVRVIPMKPRQADAKELDRLDRIVRKVHGLPEHAKIVFLEVERTDASEFSDHLKVVGARCDHHCILSTRSPIVANSIAAFLIHVEQMTECVPHIYFKWKEGNPVANIFRFLFLGEGDTAPLTHEVLRKAVSEIGRRPIVHVS